MRHPFWSTLVLSIALLFAACETGETPPPPQADTTAASETDLETSDARQSTKLNLNTATPEEFLTVPEVDERMVGEFEEYRPYRSINQFRSEIGKYVSEEQVAAYEEYVYVPILVNESDVETLQQIPGLDENEANQLVAARPFASNQAFLDSLSSLIPETERTEAEQYLQPQ